MSELQLNLQSISISIVVALTNIDEEKKTVLPEILI